VQTPGSRYCHFPLRDDYGPDYFHRLLSERLMYDEKKKQPWSWVKLPGHERNEALDCRNYALAARKALHADLESIARRLKGGVTERQTETPVVTLKPKPKPQQKRIKKSTVNKHFDDW